MTPKQWRESKGWSQDAVAAMISEKVGKPYRQSHVSGWEKGAMPDALVGDAYRVLSKGEVTARDFIKPTEGEKDNG